MDFGTILLGAISILSVLIGVPAVVMFSIYKIVKLVTEKGKLKDQKELLALEIEKQKAQIRLLEEENKKYDRIINNS
ncbi:MAG: hypothetical protein LBO67_01050 [Spirochaetaceae bacterium]|nr:hypothetical protein [Spirochaetaceae bacterium]